MKLSIIVPVYNAEKHLDKTIANVLNQTFTDIELLLIDDGSKDSSGDICDNWSKKDSRVKVIHQENTGVGGARNAGLEVAQGEYIGFVDNDDLIHPQMYEVLLGIAEKENADIVMSVQEDVWDLSKIDFSHIDIDQVHYSTLSKDTIFQNIYSVSKVDGPYMAIWNKVYRSETIRDVRYPEKGSEDLMFNSRAFEKTNRFILLDESITLYFWIQRNESQSHDFNSGYKANVLASYFQLYQEMKLSVPDYVHYALVKTYKKVLSVRYNYKHTQFETQVKEEISENYSEFIKDFLKCAKIPLYKKLGLSVFYYLPFTYSLFRTING